MLRKTTFHRVLHRPNLILGGERELVLLTGLLAGALAVASQTLVATLVSLGLWVVCLAGLRWMAKTDAQLSRVYLRHLKYPDYVPPRSRPFVR